MFPSHYHSAYPLTHTPLLIPQLLPPFVQTRGHANRTHGGAGNQLNRLGCPVAALWPSSCVGGPQTHGLACAENETTSSNKRKHAGGDPAAQRLGSCDRPPCPREHQVPRAFRAPALSLSSLSGFSTSCFGKDLYFLSVLHSSGHACHANPACCKLSHRFAQRQLVFRVEPEGFCDGWLLCLTQLSCIGHLAASQPKVTRALACAQSADTPIASLQSRRPGILHNSAAGLDRAPIST